MEKITKKDFISTVTENLTTLIGMTWEERNNITEDALEAKLDSMQFYDDEILEKRAAIAHADFLEFTGGSRLYLNQGGKFEYFRNIGPAWGNPHGNKGRFINGKSGAEFVVVKHTTLLQDFTEWTIWTAYFVHR